MTMLRRSAIFLSAMTILGIVLLWMIFPFGGSTHPLPKIATMKQQVRELSLTDLALFPEARYTRHLSLADTHAPFQDHPMALEHFPAGTHTRPPHTR